MYVAWRWDFTFEILPKMLLATLNTFMAAGLGYAIAAVVGLLFMLGQRTPYKFVNIPTREIVEFIRSTPLLVQLFFCIFRSTSIWSYTISMGLCYVYNRPSLWNLPFRSLPWGPRGCS